MGEIFRRMDKNIYELQNKDIIINALVVQSKLYSKAKRINYLSLILCVLLPISYSLTKNFLSGEILLTIGALFTIALVFISPALSTCAFKQKRTAAKIQQTIDYFLFEDDTFKTRDDEWGELYTKDELLEFIAKTKFSKKDMENKKNWYSDYSSYPHVMQAYYSQCECVRWDEDLRKCFVKGLYICGAFLITVVLILAVALKMTVFELVINIATFAPLIKVLLPLKKKLVDDCNRLKKISYEHSTINNQFGVVIGGEELYAKIIKIQRQLYDHRANAIMVPDFFYRFLRDKQQKIEDKIASQKTNGGEL